MSPFLVINTLCVSSVSLTETADGRLREEKAKSSEGRVDSSGRNGMSVEKITRWAEETALRQWHGLKAMAVIWTRDEL